MPRSQQTRFAQSLVLFLLVPVAVSSAQTRGFEVTPFENSHIELRDFSTSECLTAGQLDLAGDYFTLRRMPDRNHLLEEQGTATPGTSSGTVNEVSIGLNSVVTLIDDAFTSQVTLFEGDTDTRLDVTAGLRLDCSGKANGEPPTLQFLRSPGSTRIANRADWTTTDGFNISTFAQAANFTITDTTILRGAEVWMFAGEPGAQFTADDFSGVMTWSIVEDDSGFPLGFRFHFTDTSPILIDTNVNSDFGDSIYKVVLDGAVILDPGDYWLMLHEGAPGSAADGSSVYWAMSESDDGVPRQSNADEQGLAAAWIEGSGDLAFEILGDIAEIDLFHESASIEDLDSAYVTQTFIPSSRFITGASIIASTPHVPNGDLATVTLELWDGEPGSGGTLLASGFDTGLTSERLRYVGNWLPVAVSAGKQYLLRARYQGSPGVTPHYSYGINSYADGESELPGFDHDFMILVQGPVPVFAESFERAALDRFSSSN